MPKLVLMVRTKQQKSFELFEDNLLFGMLRKAILWQLAPAVMSLKIFSVQLRSKNINLNLEVAFIKCANVATAKKINQNSNNMECEWKVLCLMMWGKETKILD